MSLEQFKTQILLLHSEQNTLDNLCTGFNDRYTVHCATSGSEALGTLGQTDIDVLVSAQDLPGMSGVDALREAKKRSPDTIGILLEGRLVAEGSCRELMETHGKSSLEEVFYSLALDEKESERGTQ